jgi:hypothetical protein
MSVESKIYARIEHTAWNWWALQDLNLGPTDYESDALTAELRAPDNATNFCVSSSV